MDDAPVLANDSFATPGLTIFFPAFDEAEGLERTVGAALEAGDALVAGREILDYEVLIVDDASTDDTAAIASRLADKYPQVRLVQHPVNRGLGGALRTAVAESCSAWLLYTDADLPFDLLEIGKAFRMARYHDADLVSAYRFDRAGEGARRLVYSHVYNTLVRLMLGLHLRDVNFAGKLIKRDVLDRIELHSEGSFIDVELLSKAQRSGFRIVQFGVDYFPRSRGVSTLSSSSVIARMLVEMAAILPEIRAIGRRPVAR